MIKIDSTISQKVSPEDLHISKYDIFRKNIMMLTSLIDLFHYVTNVYFRFKCLGIEDNQISVEMQLL